MEKMTQPLDLRIHFLQINKGSLFIESPSIEKTLLHG